MNVPIADETASKHAQGVPRLTQCSAFVFVENKEAPQKGPRRRWTGDQAARPSGRASRRDRACRSWQVDLRETNLYLLVLIVVDLAVGRVAQPLWLNDSSGAASSRFLQGCGSFLDFLP
jgi:hypothetical protein